jgi:hypothetical protein
MKDPFDELFEATHPNGKASWELTDEEILLAEEPEDD